MRLIDGKALYEKTAAWEAQALLMVGKTMNDKDATEWKRWSTILAERSAFKFDVADAPTVDAVAEVRHGRWSMLSYDEAVCTCCGYNRNTPFDSTQEARARWGELPPYCEMCGAKMDLQEAQDHGGNP